MKDFFELDTDDCDLDVDLRIADRVYGFYLKFEDSAVPTFENGTKLKIELRDLDSTGKKLLRFCFSEQLSRREIEEQYTLVLDLVRECECDNKFLKNFPTASHFVDFIQSARRKFSSS